MFVAVLPAYIDFYSTFMKSLHGQKRAVVPLELELQKLLHHDVGAGN